MALGTQRPPVDFGGYMPTVQPTTNGSSSEGWHPPERETLSEKDREQYDNFIKAGMAPAAALAAIDAGNAESMAGVPSAEPDPAMGGPARGMAGPGNRDWEGESPTSFDPGDEIRKAPGRERVFSPEKNQFGPRGMGGPQESGLPGLDLNMVSPDQIDDEVEKNTDENGNVNWAIVIASLAAGAATALATGGGVGSFIMGAGSAASGGYQGLLKGKQAKQKQAALKAKEKSLLAGRRVKSLGELAKSQKEAKDFDGWAHTMFTIGQLQGDTTPKEEWQEHADAFGVQHRGSQAEEAVKSMNDRIKHIKETAVGGTAVTGELDETGLWVTQLENLLADDFMVLAVLGERDSEKPVTPKMRNTAHEVIEKMVGTEQQEAVEAHRVVRMNEGLRIADSNDKLRRAITNDLKEVLKKGQPGLYSQLSGLGMGIGKEADAQLATLVNGMTDEDRVSTSDALKNSLTDNWERLAAKHAQITTDNGGLAGPESLRGFIHSTAASLGLTFNQRADLDTHVSNLMAREMDKTAGPRQIGDIIPEADPKSWSALPTPASLRGAEGLRRPLPPTDQRHDLRTPDEIEENPNLVLPAETHFARMKLLRPSSSLPVNPTTKQSPSIADYTVQRLLNDVKERGTQAIDEGDVTEDSLLAKIMAHVPDLKNDPEAQKEFKEVFNQQNIDSIVKVATQRSKPGQDELFSYDKDGELVDPDFSYGLPTENADGSLTVTPTDEEATGRTPHPRAAGMEAALEGVMSIPEDIVTAIDDFVPSAQNRGGRPAPGTSKPGPSARLPQQRPAPVTPSEPVTTPPPWESQRAPTDPTTAPPVSQVTPEPGAPPNKGEAIWNNASDLLSKKGRGDRGAFEDFRQGALDALTEDPGMLDVVIQSVNKMVEQEILSPEEGNELLDELDPRGPEDQPRSNEQGTPEPDPSTLSPDLVAAIAQFDMKWNSTSGKYE